MTHTQTTYKNHIALRVGKKGARPAEVGALASLFEKSAPELKQQKLLKCKQTIQITTFNVRTLNRIDQLAELTASAVEYKIDIICIQEHRYTHTEDIKYHETGNGWTLATVSAWKNSINTTVGGIGMHSLEQAAAGIGLHVNAHITEYTCFNQTDDISTLDGTSLKLVDKFTYLGSSVSSTEKDIDTRLTKTWTAIDKLSIIWKSDLTDKIKRSFFQAAVVSILLYGCTTWTLTKRLEKKLDGNYTRMLRAILNKSWRQHPHKTPTIRPPTSHHQNYPSLTNQTHRTLLEKQGRAHK